MKVGIVGMPNAGKSSLFNALTRAGVDAANYPFTTIEPNVAVVAVADERLDAVADLVGASEIVPDTIDFHDIAGLVAGAHSGEGLGNRFLANIRETDAIVHVVRAHHDDSIIHPEGRVDPLADIETIETELVYADLEQAERRHDRVVRTARSGDRAAIAEEAWLRELIDALQSGRPARTVPPPADAPHALRDLGPLTAKPASPSTPPSRARSRSPSPAASRPSCPSSRTRTRRRCAPISACRRRGCSGSSAAPSACST
jgi:GTP-binding protein YchF